MENTQNQEKINELINSNKSLEGNYYYNDLYTAELNTFIKNNNYKLCILKMNNEILCRKNIISHSKSKNTFQINEKGMEKYIDYYEVEFIGTTDDPGFRNFLLQYPFENKVTKLSALVGSTIKYSLNNQEKGTDTLINVFNDYIEVRKPNKRSQFIDLNSITAFDIY